MMNSFFMCKHWTNYLKSHWRFYQIFPRYSLVGVMSLNIENVQKRIWFGYNWNLHGLISTQYCLHVFSVSLRLVSLLLTLLIDARIHHYVAKTFPSPSPASKTLTVKLQGLEPGSGHAAILSLENKHFIIKYSGEFLKLSVHKSYK